MSSSSNRFFTLLYYHIRPSRLILAFQFSIRTFHCWSDLSLPPFFSSHPISFHSIHSFIAFPSVFASILLCWLSHGQTFLSLLRVSLWSTHCPLSSYLSISHCPSFHVYMNTRVASWHFHREWRFYRFILYLVLFAITHTPLSNIIMSVTWIPSIFCLIFWSIDFITFLFSIFLFQFLPIVQYTFAGWHLRLRVAQTLASLRFSCSALASCTLSSSSQQRSPCGSSEISPLLCSPSNHAIWCASDNLFWILVFLLPSTQTCTCVCVYISFIQLPWFYTFRSLNSVRQISIYWGESVVEGGSSEKARPLRSLARWNVCLLCSRQGIAGIDRIQESQGNFDQRVKEKEKKWSGAIRSTPVNYATMHIRRNSLLSVWCFLAPFPYLVYPVCWLWVFVLDERVAAFHHSIRHRIALNQPFAHS